MTAFSPAATALSDPVTAEDEGADVSLLAGATIISSSLPTLLSLLFEGAPVAVD